ncbi:TetR/AcrR family transcriptional regulator [Streptomyces fulvoviolaceus]|uniref:TetR/AcrR family transcriptional regulator n=1 Tax=Streptomyces fulvoviolaceus TaxID=285535 RepID=UPI0004C5F972|nr:TetR/AcrR family transcriptional regulator [Streptomyces fulvoviolaceus]MCT9075580.1 TetR family transcriptional regulator [Streptomyces fulvoviolaceus]
MARVAEIRRPAAPMSSRQAARRVRILSAASELGAREGLAGVQMHDVAKEAGVAIGTLYRYFPSKPYLFLAVLEWHIEQFIGGRNGGSPVDEEYDPATEVAQTLIALSEKLLASPLLASAVALSSFAEYASVVPTRFDIVERALGQRLLHLLRGRGDAETERSRVRLLVYSWWGLFVAMLTEEITTEQAEADLRLAVRLIAAP